MLNKARSLEEQSRLYCRIVYRMFV